MPDEAERRELGADEDPMAADQARRDLERAEVPVEEESDEAAAKLEDAVPSDAEQRELGSEEDPMATDRARRDVERAEEPEVVKRRTTGFDLYGSARIRYRYQRDLSEWQDGGSRAGADAEMRVLPNTYIYGRYEAGFNVLTGLEDLTNPGEKAGEQFGDTVFTRLLYVGIDNPVVNAVLGKNWSTYYKIGVFTDRFMGTGGSASGTYNAQTDGGPTGPGRADAALQTQFSIGFLPDRWFKPFDLNVQVQHGNEIPFGDGAEYGTAVGLSAVLTLQNEFTLGVAYNRADIDLENDPGLRTVGLSGDASALLVGTRAFGDRWYAGFTAARLGNHETTDEGIYFKGWGSEFYGQFNFSGRWWVVGGYNALEPNDDQLLARDYRIRYGVAGLRYSLDEFRRMIFLNVRVDDSRNADGTEGSDVITIGIRWDVSKRGWGLYE